MVEASSRDLRMKNTANRPAIPWLLPRQRAQADLLKSENGGHHDRRGRWRLGTAPNRNLPPGTNTGGSKFPIARKQVGTEQRIANPWVGDYRQLEFHTRYGVRKRIRHRRLFSAKRFHRVDPRSSSCRYVAANRRRKNQGRRCSCIGQRIGRAHLKEQRHHHTGETERRR